MFVQNWIDKSLFQERYRVPSARLQSYDYRSAGWYFLTICTRNKIPWFGQVNNGIVGLSDVGCVVAQEWQKSASIRSNVELDEWIIMPDHMHGIILINGIDRTIVETARRAVSTDVASLIPLPCLRSNSLGAIVGRFKYACTKRIRSMGYDDFAWQTRFHDRVIRSTDELHCIRQYIRNNPLQ